MKRWNKLVLALTAVSLALFMDEHASAGINPVAPPNHCDSDTANLQWSAMGNPVCPGEEGTFSFYNPYDEFQGLVLFQWYTQDAGTNVLFGVPISIESGRGTQGGVSSLGWEIDTYGIGEAAEDIQSTLSVVATQPGTTVYGIEICRGCQDVPCSQPEVETGTLVVSVAATAAVTGGGTICPGQSAIIQADLTGTAPWTVTWSDGVTEYNVMTPSVTRTVAPPSTTTYTVTSLLDSSGNNCTETSSNSVTVTVGVFVTTNPSDQSVCVGQPVSFTAAAGGSPTPTVQWQVSTDEGVTFSDISGATSTTLAFTPGPADNNKKYRAEFSNVNCTSYSTVASLAVGAPSITNAVVILTQPVSVMSCPGGSATFSVGATGDSLTYQWQKNGVNLINDANILGANSATLTINSVGSLGSGNGSPIANTVWANNSSGVPFGSVIGGYTYLYQASGCVEFNDNGGFSDPDGYLYSGSCTNFEEKAVSVPASDDYICPGTIGHSLIGEVNGDCVQLGTSGSFVAPTSGTLTLYYNDQAGGFRDNIGSFNVVITPANMADTYDVVVTGGCGSQTSVPVTLSVASPTATISGSATICLGQSTQIRVALTGTGPWSVAWADDAGELEPLTANASPATRTVIPTGTGANYYHLIAVSDAYCEGTVSGVAMVTVVSSGNTVATPTFSPQPGVYLSSVSVTVSCATTGASIHYTTNGLMPTLDDPSISSGSAVTLSQPILLQARAFTNGFCASAVAAGLYQIGPVLTGGWDDEESDNQSPNELGLSFMVWTNGNLWGWGSTAGGSLGTNILDAPDASLPFPSSYATNVISVSSGEGRTSFVDTSGVLRQSGRNTELFSTTVLNNLVSVSQGYDFTVALTTYGTVLAWGQNGSGQLGQGSTLTPSSTQTPVRVLNLTQVTAVAAGSEFAMALRSDGTVWAWGDDSVGQMGDCNGCQIGGSTTNWVTATQVSGVSNVVAIAAGAVYAVVVEADGTVWTWGDDSEGELGTGDAQINSGSSVPMQVAGLSNVVGVAAPSAQNSYIFYTLAWTAQGQAYSWGVNVMADWSTYGMLGTGDTTDWYLSTPQLIPGLSNVRAMSAAADHALAESLCGGVYVFWSWGLNGNGELGDGTTVTRTIPTLVHVPFDTDGDGMPDWQKCQFGVNPFNPYQSGDELLNGINLYIGIDPADNVLIDSGLSIADVLSGYDPFNPSSYPDLSPVNTWPVITLTEPAIAVLIQ